VTALLAAPQVPPASTASLQWQRITGVFGLAWIVLFALGGIALDEVAVDDGPVPLMDHPLIAQVPEQLAWQAPPDGSYRLRPRRYAVWTRSESTNRSRSRPEQL
jgi:hypothetical protein